jgi:HNH endonuclease
MSIRTLAAPRERGWHGYYVPVKPEKRFWPKVNKRGPLTVPRLGRCWQWIGGRNRDGYSTFGLDGSHTSGHRFSWELHNGPVPKGKELDHLCGNLLCVRPSHLEPVTHRENMLRGTKNVAGIAARKTRCKRGHLFDRVRKDGSRACSTCRKLTKAVWDARKKARAALAKWDSR